MSARNLIPATLALLIVVALLGVPAASAEEACPNAVARQGPSGSLPDCRVYEQLTPPDKGDSQDLFETSGLNNLGDNTSEAGYAADDGERFLLTTPGSFAGGDAYRSTYVFSRGPGGWATTAISPGPGVHLVQASVFDPADLSRVGVGDLQLNHLPGQPEERALVNIAGPTEGPYTTIDSAPSVSVEDGDMVGASADLSHIVVESPDHELALGDGAQDEGSTALYDWSDGHMQLVNVTTGGSLVSTCGAGLGLGVYSSGAGSNSTLGGTHNAVSSDGSKIIFTAPNPYLREGAGCWNPQATPQENPPQLYMRENGASTVEISAPNTGVHDPGGPQPVLYAGASSDGSKVFFITKTQLTADATTHTAELYEYDANAAEGKRLTRISSGESGAAEGDVDFVGAISNDGSTVYFAAFGKLATGASALSDSANAKASGLVERGGGVNLYRYDTVTRKTAFVAKINGNDYPLKPGEDLNRWFTDALDVGGARSAEPVLQAPANWYTTANGQYLLFGSNVPLTGYDNMHAAAVKECQSLYSASQTPRCVELFRYDARDESIVCVSCAGGAPVDNARFNRDPLEIPDALPPRPISEDGSYVFFETLNALVPQTTAGVLHVYEWHDGKIALISTAGDTSNSYFLGASANGRDVFFGTHAQLAAQDTDVGGDLYDARVDGGFPTVVPSQCTGTGCQGVPSAPPIFATPASVTFEGLGNFLPKLATPAQSRAKAVARAQKLTRALRVCRRVRSKRKRARCTASARARYGRLGTWVRRGRTSNSTKSDRKGN